VHRDEGHRWLRSAIYDLFAPALPKAAKQKARG
jgi:hypothetical protein